MNGEQNINITTTPASGSGEQLAQGIITDPLPVYAEVVQIQALKAQQEKLQAQCDAIKKMAREAEKKAEIAKHKSPQIKRSMDFLLDTKFKVSDAKDLLEKAVSGEGDIYSVLCLLDSKLDELAEKVESEITANRIASKATFGWKTVKCFESDSLFQGADAEALTKKFKAAEYQAAKESFRSRRGRGSYGGKASFHPYSYSNQNSRFSSAGRGGFTQTTTGPAATITSGSSANSKSCYGCGLEGHMVKYCPVKK